MDVNVRIAPRQRRILMKKIVVALVCCLVGQIFFAPQEPSAASSQIEPQTDSVPLAAGGSPAEFVPGEILVKFKSQVTLVEKPGIQTSTNRGSLNTRWKVKVSSRLSLFSRTRQSQAWEPGSPSTANAQAAARSLDHLTYCTYQHKTMSWQRSKRFRPTRKRRIRRAELCRGPDLTAPNHPGYGQQWGLPAVYAEEAWTITKGNPAVTIAILDTGVDLNHPDLAGKTWTNPGEIPGNGIDDDGNGYIDDVSGYDFVNLDNTAQDDNGHGTHVAGIAAAWHEGGCGCGWRMLELQDYAAQGIAEQRAWLVFRHCGGCELRQKQGCESHQHESGRL